MINWLKKYFIPHEHNDHKPHILRQGSVRAIAITVIFLEIFTFLIPVVARINTNGGMASVLPAILSDLTNKERQSEKLNTLSISEKLNKVAQMKANDMAEKGYFAHESPEGKTPWYWFDILDYKYQYAGENLAINFTDSKDVTDAWMQSPTHKANITKNKYTEVGTAVAKGMYEGKETFFVVQVYAKPLVVSSVTTKQIEDTPKNILPENKKVLGAEAEVKSVQEIKTPTAVEKAIASPRNTSNILFIIIFTIIAISLVLNIFIKMKKQHVNLITNGLVTLALIGAVLVVNYYITHSKQKVQILETESTENLQQNTSAAETRSLCFYRGTKTDRGFYDRAWLKLNVTGEKVSGEFRHSPAETDSKVGKFEGTMGPLDQSSMSRSADVWWDSLAEGMEVKEELSIKWGDGSATVGFGEMTDRGDGVYVYKDASKLYWIDPMTQMDCDSLDKKLFIEQYVRDNIGEVATNKPVLGGTWYAISINVNPSTRTGEVTYEDGHIQSKANFTYTYNKVNNEIKFTKFEVVK